MSRSRTDGVSGSRFHEPFAESYRFRCEQHDEMESYVRGLLEKSIEKRARYFAPDLSSPNAYARSIESYRADFRRLIGMPSEDAAFTPETAVEKSNFEGIGEDKAGTYYRCRIPVAEGLTSYGIYIEPAMPAESDKIPLVIACHGGGGCPEAICDLDTREPYHEFGPEAARRGYAVWAPYILMTVGYGGDPPRARDRYFYDRLAFPIGLRIVGIEVFKISHSLRAILAMKNTIDTARIAMAGLSYGGYFSLGTTAVGTEISACVASGIFRDYTIDEETIDTLGTSLLDRTFTDGYNTFDPPNIAGLVCPRPLLIQNGENDTVVPISGAKRAQKRVRERYEALGIPESFSFHAHPGAHEFENARIFEFLESHGI